MPTTAERATFFPMLGVPHETMAVLLRDHPEWLRALVEVVAKRVLPENLRPADATVRVVNPAEVRLDLLFASADGSSWALVEVQLDEDPAKARKWPLAVAALWNERGVEGDLIVITGECTVASWARTVGDMEGPLGTALSVRPVVVQLTGDVADDPLRPRAPRVRVLRRLDGARPLRARGADHRRAGDGPLRHDPRRGVATLADPAHPRRAPREAREDDPRGVHGPAEDPGEPRAAAPRRGVPGDVRRRVGGSREVCGEARMLLKILAARKLPADDATRAHILGCTDTETLELWAGAVLTATSIGEVFRGRRHLRPITLRARVNAASTA